MPYSPKAYATRGAAMDDALDRKHWKELAERASVENDPGKLVKLVEELLAELNRVKEKTSDSTA